MHGGDWTSFEETYGKMPLDFSANISPLGVPEKVKQAVIRAAGEADRYPDPYCRQLRGALGETEQIPPEYILCGNGAADLIWRLAAAMSRGSRRAEYDADRDGKQGTDCDARRGTKTLLPIPGFSEYRAALEACGCAVETYALREEENFRLTERFLPVLQDFLASCNTAEKRTCGQQMPGNAKGEKRAESGNAAGKYRGSVWLCEPGNPSGVTTDPALLRQILEYCGKAGVLLVIDECFLELTDDPEGHTMKGMLQEYPNLLILRAFTKTYAMAGLRLGCCLCSDTDLLGRMQEAGQPWGVSHIAQAAGMAALADTEYRDRVRALIREERPVLQHGLEEQGFRVIPGEANFLLFYDRNAKGIPEHTGMSSDLSDRLEKEGILIRGCSDFEGLSDGWYRVAVRTKEENQKLLNTLARIDK